MDSPKDSSALTPFVFEGAEVRLVMRDGEPWFVAADVCARLGISNSRDAIGKLDADEKGVASTDTLGGRQEMAVVSESGMYTLILRCREATTPGTVPHRFRKWVTAEVLPAIRKTGGYGVQPALTREEQIAHALIASQQIVEEQRTKIRRLEPKAEVYDRIADADGSLCITDAAKTLQLRPKDLFAFLRANGWIYSRPGTSDIGRQEKLNAGLLVHKVEAVVRTDGSEKITTQVRVTPKGVTRLAGHFRQSVAA